jgi:hypothetical protein
MNDQNFELEQNLPTRAKEIINKRRFQINDARRRVELLAARYEKPEAVQPHLVPLDLVTQVAQNESDSVRILNNVRDTDTQPQPEATQSPNGDLNIDEIRKLVEAA